MVKRILKAICHRLFGEKKVVSYCGDYTSWEEAQKNAVGYDCDNIFKKVADSTLKVVEGKAAYERDSVLFYDPTYNYPLIAWIVSVGKKLSILDFGGALGSTYYQNRNLMENMCLNIRWYIKEQEHFVEFGKKYLENEKIRFVNSFDDIRDNIDILLFSSSLQYLENYEKELKKSIDILKPSLIILERTPVGARDRIWIETVTEPIYDASYVCRMISEDNLIKQIENNGEYILLDSWHSLVDSDIRLDNEIAEFKSFVFRKGK